MTRAILVLHNDTIRERAVDWIWKAPQDTRVTFSGPKRTLPQNAMIHVLATEIASQLAWAGQKRTVPVWKKLLMDLYDHERGHMREMLPALHGEGFVPLDGHTSDLSVEEATEFIECIYSFGAQHGVTFHEPEDGARPVRMKR